jgi:hypothetical protein
MCSPQEVECRYSSSAIYVATLREFLKINDSRRLHRFMHVLHSACAVKRDLSSTKDHSSANYILHSLLTALLYCIININIWLKKLKLNSVAWSARELYRHSDRRLSSKLVSTFADRGCHVVSVTDAYNRILGFLDRSRYCFFRIVPQLYSRGWVDPVPDPLLLIKSGSAGNRTRTSVSVARNSDH